MYNIPLTLNTSCVPLCWDEPAEKNSTKQHNIADPIEINSCYFTQCDITKKTTADLSVSPSFCILIYRSFAWRPSPISLIRRLRFRRHLWCSRLMSSIWTEKTRQEEKSGASWIQLAAWCSDCLQTERKKIQRFQNTPSSVEIYSHTISTYRL